MTDERIIKALERIEPDAAAQHRMYANIIRKADEKRKSMNTLKIVRPLVSAAACVCLVIAAAAAFRFGASSFENTSSGGADMDFAAADFKEDAYFDNGYASYEIENTAAEFSTSAPGVIEEKKGEVPAEEPAAGAAAGDNAVAAPSAWDEEGADNAECNVEQESAVEVAEDFNAGTAAAFSFVFPDGASVFGKETASDDSYAVFEADFEYEGHLYNIKVLNVNGESFAAETGSMVSVEADITSGANAVFYRADNGNEKIITVTWSDESLGFVMSNADGAEENEFVRLSETVIENNRSLGR